MGNKKPQHIENIGWRYATEHNKLRRMSIHDYQSRSIYMLTLTLANRRQHLLGELSWNKTEQPSCPAPDTPQHTPSNHNQADNNPRQDLHNQAGRVRRSLAAACFTPSPLGLLVEQEWRNLCREHPQLQVIRTQLMPEHLHVILFAKERLPMPIGKYIGVIKNRCNKHYWHMLETQGTLSPEDTPPSFFGANFQDTILSHNGQLETMISYVEQNPYRALVKRDNPNLFTVIDHIRIGDQTFAAIGNRWLLDRPVKMQVRCHNNVSPENLKLIAKQKKYFLQRGATGGVIVSPCISAGEREIAHAALDAQQPLIVILENGFPPLYKPKGKYFTACADGLLLMLAPWPYHTEKRAITRMQCNELNKMAQIISNEPWTMELEQSISNEL